MEKTKLLTPGGGEAKKTELPDYGGAQNQFTNNESLTFKKSCCRSDVTSDTEQPPCNLEELCGLMKLRGCDARDRLFADYGSVEGLCQRLRTHPDNGLNADDLHDTHWRKVVYGTNVLMPKSSPTFLQLIWEALNDLTLIILIIAAVVSLGISFFELPGSGVEDDDPTEGEAGCIESVGILTSVVIIVLATAFINRSKDLQFQGLQKQLGLQSKYSVVRSGQIHDVSVADIVVGDICIVQYGDVIPADGILISSNDLNVDESMQTGESEDVMKAVESDIFLRSGATVVDGSGRMVVTAVGIHSATGVMYALLRQTNDADEKRSVLRQKLNKLVLLVTYAGVALTVVTLVILVTRFSIETFIVNQLPWQSAYIHTYIGFIIIAITELAVAIPEGLPLAVILSLAYSIRKMMQDNNLVRHLDACETMGNATTLCCDKTGTLTANRMTVVQGYIAGQLCSTADDFGRLPQDAALLLACAISVNSSYTSSVESDSWGSNSKNSSEGPIGNKTECALLSIVSVLGPSKVEFSELRRRTPESSFVKTYTFNSQRKWMATVVPAAGQPRVGTAERGVEDGVYRIYVKGAPERIIDRCDWILGQGGHLERLTTDARMFIVSDVINKMASDGLRTLCIACRNFSPGDNVVGQAPNWNDEDDVVSRLICVGIVGIEDPLRPEVTMAIRQCQHAGITVRMVTGDSVRTAAVVARKCGILNNGEDVLVLDSDEFNRLVRRKPNEPIDQDLMDSVWPHLRVLARSSPEDKYNLVKGIMESRILHDRQIVAVTGDGSNDAPALRKADVGLAMGLSGTDVAKEASDIIIMDDNFASIVKAVIWGRHIYDSLAKFIQFQLTVNVIAVLIVLIGACFIADAPLKGMQMLWVNLLMDTLAAISLSAERPSDELLNRRPYRYSEPIVSPQILVNIISHAIFELFVLLVLLFAGETLLDVDSGRDRIVRGIPTVHYTFVFNSFVMMTLFNEICARQLGKSPNVFAGIHRSPWFVVIWLASFAAQVIIIQFGGNVFFTVALSLDLWLWCLFIGISDLLFAEVVFAAVTGITWLRSLTTCVKLKHTSTSSNNNVDNMSSYSGREMQCFADNKPSCGPDYYY